MQKKKFITCYMNSFFKKKIVEKVDYRNNLHPKAVFVLAENIFRKSFYMKPCVWLRMENRFFRKIIYFDLENIFNFCFTFKSFPETCKERKRERKDSQMCKQRERERERERDCAVEFEIKPVRSPSSSPPRDGEIAPRTHELIDSPRPPARSRHEPTNRSPSSSPPRDGEIATNPRTDRPTSSTGEIATRTHEPIDPSLILTDEPTNWLRHDWSCDFDFFFFWFLFLVLFICFNYL